MVCDPGHQVYFEIGQNLGYDFTLRKLVGILHLLAILKICNILYVCGITQSDCPSLVCGLIISNLKTRTFLNNTSLIPFSGHHHEELESLETRKDNLKYYPGEREREGRERCCILSLLRISRSARDSALPPTDRAVSWLWPSLPAE